MNSEPSMESILRFWQQIITDEEMPVQNRMKASELLYRSLQQDTVEKTVEVRPADEADLTARIEKAEAIIAKYAGKRGGGHEA